MYTIRMLNILTPLGVMMTEFSFTYNFIQIETLDLRSVHIKASLSREKTWIIFGKHKHLNGVNGLGFLMAVGWEYLYCLFENH